LRRAIQKIKLFEEKCLTKAAGDKENVLERGKNIDGGGVKGKLKAIQSKTHEKRMKGTGSEEVRQESGK